MYQDPKNSTLLFPSDTDYRIRTERAQAAMKQAGVDVLAISGSIISLLHRTEWPANRQTDLVGAAEQGGPAFVSPRSEAKEIRARCNAPVAAEWVEWEEPIPAPMTHQDALAKYIAEVAPEARTIGVDFNSTWALNIELVKGALGAERINDATLMLRGLLALKNAVAINAIRWAPTSLPISSLPAVKLSLPTFPNGRWCLLPLPPGSREMRNC